MVPILGLIIGILIGVFFIPVNIPSVYSNYVAVAILAALDSVFGGIAAGGRTCVYRRPAGDTDIPCGHICLRQQAVPELCRYPKACIEQEFETG